MLEAFPGFRVFVGSEQFLLANLRAGGAGCITATANLNAPAIARLYRDWQTPDADRLQAELDEVRAIFQSFPLIAALKAALGWTTARTKATATDASTAVPPLFNTSSPTCEAIGSAETTIPSRAVTALREAPTDNPAEASRSAMRTKRPGTRQRGDDMNAAR